MRKIHLRYPLPSGQGDLLAETASKAIAIGHFDGVHRGHQAVIAKAVELARQHGIESAVMTIHPHPKEVLGQGQHYTAQLTPLEEKLACLAELGVDTAYVLHFDRQLAALEPVQFVEQVLAPLQIRHAVVGFDFSFGHRGGGNADTLRELGQPLMQVEVVSPVHLDGAKVSSTRIRDLLGSGLVEEAADLLGRPYAVSGIVSHGDGRGKTIGFPTANITPADRFVYPRLGVYAAHVWLGNERHNCIINLGIKPTFQNEAALPVLEAHIFDFGQDIYGKPARVDFLAYIRPEQKFGSAQELVGQIRADVDKARELLAEKSIP